MNNTLNDIKMKLGNRVKFKYGDNVVVGKLTDKKDKQYLVDIETINNEPVEYKTVITVTTSTVLNYLLNT